MMQSAGESATNKRANATLPMLGIAILVAAVCIFGAGIPTATWAELFHHPARQPIPEVTLDGARLWRFMLTVLALSMLIIPFTLMRLSSVEGGSDAKWKLDRKVAAFLLAIAAVAIAFRLTRLTESLWYDEIASWMTYSAGVPSSGWTIIANFRDPMNQVAHSLLNHWSVKLLAESLGIEIAFRLPALAFSMLSVFAMFGLARAAFNRRVGMIAALLMATMPVSVLEGAEARGYSMMICFSALMSWTWLESVRRRAAWLWLAYAACCALGIWAHFVTAFVPIGQCAWLLWRGFRSRDWQLLFSGMLALALAAIMTLTLYAPMLPDMLFSRDMFFTQRGGVPKVLGHEGLHALLQIGGSWYWWAALPGLVLALVGTIHVFQRPASQRDPVAAALLGLPLMVLTVVLSDSWIYARFTLFALPGFLLLMSLGVDWLWTRRPMLGILACGIIGVFSIADLALRPPKQPLRDAADLVRANWNLGDRIVIIGLAHPVSRIYLNDLQPTYSYFFGSDLESKLDAVHPTWLIIEYPHHAEADRFELLQTRGFRTVQQFEGWADWKHGDVIVMRKEMSTTPHEEPQP